MAFSVFFFTYYYQYSLLKNDSWKGRGPIQEIRSPQLRE